MTAIFLGSKNCTQTYFLSLTREGKITTIIRKPTTVGGFCGALCTVTFSYIMDSVKKSLY